MLYDEYNLDEHLECRYEEGVEDGIEKGERNRDNYVINLINQGLSTEEIKQRLESDKN